MQAWRFLLIGALFAGGCVTSSDMQKMQSQIDELQEQLARIKQTTSSKEDMRNVNQRVAEQTQQLLKSNATLVAKVDQIQERANSTQGSIEQTNYRLDRLTQQIAQAQHDIEELKAAAGARSAAAPPPAAMPAATTTAPQPPMTEIDVSPPAAGSDDPRDLYQAAYRDYQRGNFDLAIAGFRDFLTRYPNSDLAVNAQYWIGESLYSRTKYIDAIDQFDLVVQKYPKSEKAPGALLKKGFAYLALNQRPQAIVQFQYVVHEYPNAHEAGLAKDKLKQLGVDIK